MKITKFLFVLTALSVCFVLAACAPEAAPEAPGEEEQAPSEEEEEEAAPSAPEAKPVTWKMQSLTTAAMRYHEVVVRVAERVGEMSGGMLTIETYPTGAIASAGEEFDGVHNGILDACLAGHMNQLDLYPAAGLFYQVVGGMTAAQMQLWYLAGGGDGLAAEMYEGSNCHYVSTSLLHPPEIWCHSTKEIKKVSDMNGLKIRAAGDAGEILAMMGASTVMIPGSEVYESAARGVIDAFEYGGPAINWGMGFHEIADYLYLSPSRAPTGGSGIFVNEKSWGEISPELQAMVKYAAMSETQLWYAEQLVLNDGALQQYIDYGTMVAPLPAEIDEEFVATAEEFYDGKAGADPFFKEVLDSQRAFKALCELQDVR